MLESHHRTAGPRIAKPLCSPPLLTSPSRLTCRPYPIAMTVPPEPHAPSHEMHSRVQHHFDSAQQQFDAAKLGMWLFLATEVLLFGGLFTAYAVLHQAHPEVFKYGSQFLDRKFGATNTIVLILSSLTMALAVSAAQRGKRLQLIALLSLTIAGGATFMGIKYLEYKEKISHGLVWGAAFYNPPAAHDATSDAFVMDQPFDTPGDAVRGKALWLETCRQCHGIRGEGIPGQGKDHRGSPFIKSRSDRQLVNFIAVGRGPKDPLNTTGILMPPRGGNPLLDDDDLHDIVSYIRTFDGIREGEPDNALDEALAAVPGENELITHSTMPPAANPSQSIVPEMFPTRRFHTNEVDDSAHVFPLEDPNRPANAHLFFTIYFLMTGLHGVHVLVGMAVIGWVLIGALRKQFDSAYYTPVDLAGLYWHIVDLIWIFLFPLFYLLS